LRGVALSRMISIVLRTSGGRAFACMLLTVSCGAFGSAEEDDGAADAASSEPPDRDAAAEALDGATPEAAAPEAAAPDAAAPDADSGDAEPCLSPKVIAGSDSLQGTTDDPVPARTMDTYAYRALARATARCAWFYVAVPRSGGDIRIGVYGSSNTNQPGALRGHARLAGLTVGWHKAPLDQELLLEKDEIVWLGFLPRGSALTLRHVKNCSTPFPMHAHTNLDDLPANFVRAHGDTYCAAAAYLGP
jgi:hypothetical protein